MTLGEGLWDLLCVSVLEGQLLREALRVGVVRAVWECVPLARGEALGGRVAPEEREGVTL